jgi:3-isopropylmalate/(R)-2-methylmalate dehydratase large subunit
MKKNIIDKIWDSHVVKQEKDTPDILFLDLQLLHEVTSPQAFDLLRSNNQKIFDPTRNIATLDHSIPTNQTRDDFVDEKNKIQLDTLRKNCKDFGVELYDIGSGKQGVVHITAPELGLIQPGMTVCCGDSHTATHGAFGSLAFGIGTTQVYNVLATSCLLLDRPKTMKVNFIGTPSKYFKAKDLILALINRLGVQGGTGYAIEYTGEFIKNCSMEERMTISNMSIECGARSGLMSPDDRTFDWLMSTNTIDEYEFKKAIYEWKSYISDENAYYDKSIDIDISDLKPFVTWGTTPAQSVQINKKIPNINEIPEDEQSLAKKSLEYTELKAGDKLEGIPIKHVFIGSCTNGRISDLEESANLLINKKIDKNVRMFVVPGSEKVEKEMIEKGLDVIFKKAGAILRRPGCSMCLAMNGDLIPSRERCVSTSNRNFIGRQGPDSITHLASPLVATLSAITGKITNPEEYFS